MSKNKWGVEVQPDRVCAIDASTNSLAFAVFDKKNLKEIGNILSIYYRDLKCIFAVHNFIIICIII